MGRDNDRWQVLATRAADGHPPFYYGVVTTGVYCRSGCSSRLPRRENVVFFDTSAQAEGAGYRPCRRCAPHRAGDGDHRRELALRVCRLIDGSDRLPTLAELAASVGVSPGHLHKVVKSVLGVTPRDYALARRDARFRERLTAGATVSEAAYAAGFGSASRLYDRVGQSLGMKPRTYARRGVGRTIRFGTAACTLGRVLVAATDQGVCAVLLGDGEAELVRQLGQRFSAAHIAAGGPGFTATVAAVVACVEEPRSACGLPLDVRGTVFQERVWQALRKIPAGETITYGELAARLGVPAAARAVGRACAENPAAVLIPCHRAVPAGGGLAGYRWGVERKRELLLREKDP